MPDQSTVRSRPTISIDMLAKMAKRLSPHELAKLPLHKLPPSVPAEALRGAPQANRAVLHDMFVELEAQRTHEHVKDLHFFGKEIAGAFQKAESTGAPNPGKWLGDNLKSLATTLNSWRNNRTTQSREDQGKSFESFNEQFENAYDTIMQLRGELAEYNQAEHILRNEASKAGAQSERITDAVGALREKTQPVRSTLSQFYSLRLSVCVQEMESFKRRVDTVSYEQEELQAQIDALRAELETKKSVWRKALKRYRSSDDYSEIQMQITRLIAERRSREIMVQEQSVQRWLDAIVDASLDTSSAKLVRDLMPIARDLLYWSLNQYCHQQEASAKQIARNPFAQINSEDAINFLLLSEQFLLDYFVRRKEENPFWFSAAVEERRDGLDSMMQELLHELEVNIKSFCK